MNWYIRVVTPPAVEPLDLATVKAHCRIDRTDEDAGLTGLMVAAREMVETETSRALITQTVELGLEDFPRREDRIRLPRGNFQAVSLFRYTDTGNVAHDMVAGTNYILNQYAEPAEIVLPWSMIWPSIVLQTAAPVRIQFTAGWADAASVPQPIKLAMLLLIADWYENREDEVIGRGIVSIETKNGMDRLLNNYCLRNYTPFTR